MKIAIVDDDVNDRELLIQLIKVSLEHEAYALDITQFDSGESLLEAFEPEQFDICFLDIYMKEMNGMTVARATSRWRTSSVPWAKRWKCPKPSSKSCRRVLWCAAPA